MHGGARGRGGRDGRLSASSVELLLDDDTERAVRSCWNSLAAAGLPSLGSHTAASNRPHVTLVAGAGLEAPDSWRGGAAVASGHDEFRPLPLPIALVGLLCFPRQDGRFVLAIAVVPSAPLLALQSAVAARCAGADPLTAPGAWTPHVTLCRRLRPELLGEAAQVAAAALAAPGDARAVAARHWDGAARVLTPLG